MSDSPRYRFAPSPTGFFHVGGARTALYNWALALRTGGTFVLRIEDTDESRNSPEWTQGIIDALSWLGIDSQSPRFEGPYFQSQNAELHIAAAMKLHTAGKAYWCDLTADQIQERAKSSGKQGYDGYSRDRGLAGGPGHVLRFRVPEGATIVSDLVRGEVEFANDTIEKVFQNNENADVYYGDTIITNEQGEVLRNRRLRPPANLSWQSMQMGMIVCHQSIFVKKTIAVAYQTKYRISADIDWLIRCLNQAKMVCNTGLVISKFLDGSIIN